MRVCCQHFCTESASVAMCLFDRQAQFCPVEPVGGGILAKKPKINKKSHISSISINLRYGALLKQDSLLCLISFSCSAAPCMEPALLKWWMVLLIVSNWYLLWKTLLWNTANLVTPILCRALLILPRLARVLCNWKELRLCVCRPTRQ